MLSEYSTASKQTSKAALVVSSYATSSLASHLKQAFLDGALKSDDLAVQTLLHEADAIVDQALQATTIELVEELAEWFAGGGEDPWSACRLLDSLGSFAV